MTITYRVLRNHIAEDDASCDMLDFGSSLGHMLQDLLRRHVAPGLSDYISHRLLIFATVAMSVYIQ